MKLVNFMYTDCNCAAAAALSQDGSFWRSLAKQPSLSYCPALQCAAFGSSFSCMHVLPFCQAHSTSWRVRSTKASTHGVLCIRDFFVAVYSILSVLTSIRATTHYRWCFRSAVAVRGG